MMMGFGMSAVFGGHWTPGAICHLLDTDHFAAITTKLDGKLDGKTVASSQHADHIHADHLAVETDVIELRSIAHIDHFSDGRDQNDSGHEMTCCISGISCQHGGVTTPPPDTTSIWFLSTFLRSVDAVDPVFLSHERSSLFRPPR